MLFNSLVYIFIFLPITIIVYFLLLKKRCILFSKIWLVICSLFFYGWWNPKYTILLIFSILVNYWLGIAFHNQFFSLEKKRKILLLIGLCFNLLLLCYYKYMNFFIDNINLLFNTDIYISKIALPLGISFYTFTQVAYIVDSYKGNVREYNLINYTLFVTFFPHLIAGPILYHKDIMPQFDDLRKKIFNYKNFTLGLFLFIIGLFKKVCLADVLALYVQNGFYEPSKYSILESWIVFFSHSFQVYFDFSGYSDMALGVAKMMNISLPINFNSPYKAISTAEFWKRWHMTLTNFIKNYVYIPLGGSRKGTFRTYLNIFITMFFVGLWHGASWCHVAFALIHGIALAIHKLYVSTKAFLPKYIAHVITIFFVFLVALITISKSYTQIMSYYSSLFDFSSLILPKIENLNLFFEQNNNLYKNILLILPLSFILIFFCKNSNEIIERLKIKNKKNAIMYGIIFSVLFILSIVRILLESYTEFIYFNF